MSRPIEPTRKKLKPAAVEVSPPVGEPLAAPVSAPLPAKLDTYDQALAFFSQRANVERTAPAKVDPRIWRLDRMRGLMDALGNPQRDFKCVHVAGSKGKGSTCEMVASCLAACGYATGLYTSPHLVDLRERVRIGRQMISQEAFLDQARRIAAALPGVEKKFGEATFLDRKSVV